MKGLLKRFPELSERNMSFDDLINISEAKIKDHVIYARVVHDIAGLKNKYTVMDLSNPMMSDQDKSNVDRFVKETQLEFHPKEFLEMYHSDQLGGLIRNVETWIQDIFKKLVINK
jgi:hypothetical protein